MKKLHAKAWGFFSLLASRPTNRHGPYSYISLSGQEFRICFLLLAAKSYVVYTRHLKVPSQSYGSEHLDNSHRRVLGEFPQTLVYVSL